MRKSGCCLGLSALLLAQAGAASGTTAKAVSPGSLVEEPLIADRCPTFSWTGVAAAAGYELVVYAIRGEDNVSEAAPALHVEIPGGALSWTPARRDCLAPDSGYAWVIRALVDGSAGDWSEALRFQTPGEIPEEELVAAVALLRRYVESGGSLEAIAQPASGPMKAGAVTQPAQGPGRPRSPARSSPAPDSQNSPGAERVGTRELVVPIGTLGVNSSIDVVLDSVAVRGGHRGSAGLEPAVGYLGVGVPEGAQSFAWDGFPELGALAGNHIGVLGFAKSRPLMSSPPAVGVVGVSDSNNGTAGLFLRVDSAGEVDAEVRLAHGTMAIRADGEVHFLSKVFAYGDVSVLGSLDCPAQTDRAGAWCIGGQQDAATYYAAAQTCWGLDMQICPLDAILACDETEPPGADCSTATDAATTTWIWCAEQPTAADVSGFTGGAARVFAHAGNNTGNEVDFRAKSNEHIYFCCLPRR